MSGAPHPLELVHELQRALVPGRVTVGESDRDLHGSDLTFHASHRPDLVVYPESTEEVVRILALATAHRTPVTAFGAGYEPRGPRDPGLRRNQPRPLAASRTRSRFIPASWPRPSLPASRGSRSSEPPGEHGLFFPVDPGADATLGGMAATNAAGTTTVRYGKMRANVLALEAVLADGAVIRTGSRAPKSSAGYDLTSVLVGSEGTLAVITELTLRLQAHPRARRGPTRQLSDDRGGLHDSGLRGGGRGSSDAARASRPLDHRRDQRLLRDLVPRDTLPVRRIDGQSGDGGSRPRARSRDRAGRRCDGDRRRGGARRADPPLARAARSRPRGRGLRPGSRERTTDVCVPITELPAAVHFARAELGRLGLAGGIRPRRRREPARERPACFPTIRRRSSGRRASCTQSWPTPSPGVVHPRASTGSGSGRSTPSASSTGTSCPCYRAIKRAFDPLGILNPGKILATA